MYIYVITNSATGKVYIGQHKGTNLRKYLQDKMSQAWYELKRTGGGRGSHLYASMRKHPKEVWTIDPLMEFDTKVELDRWETLLIALYDTRNPEVGYNICRGGEGFTGKHTEEWKQNKRKQMTGRVFSPESLAKMKAAPKSAAQLDNLKRCQDADVIAKRTETKKRIGYSDKHMEHWQDVLANHRHVRKPGEYTHSSETRAKLSASLKDRKATNFVDMEGKSFNGVEVLSKAENTKKGKARWSCKCHCGTSFVAEGYNLRSGKTKGCGCTMPQVFRRNK